MDARIRRLRSRLEAVRRGKTPRGVRYSVPLRAAVAELYMYLPIMAIEPKMPYTPI
jgi:hypothetical protein